VQENKRDFPTTKEELRRRVGNVENKKLAEGNLRTRSAKKKGVNERISSHVSKVSKKKRTTTERCWGRDARREGKQEFRNRGNPQEERKGESRSSAQGQGKNQQ